MEKRAERFEKKVVDISKYLHDTGYEKPKTMLKTRITYHDACHLAHGQGVRQEPRDILLDIPGVEMVQMPNADRCCGSAGIYNLTNPDMADAVLKSKMENVPEDVEMISMGNPGCMMQMALGVQKYGRNQKIVHTVQLLDWAYQKREWNTTMAVLKLNTTDKHIINLAAIVDGPRSILYKKVDVLAYDCDGFTIHKHLPKAVVFRKIQKKFPN